MTYLQPVAARQPHPEDFEFPIQAELAAWPIRDLNQVWRRNNQIFLRLIKGAIIPFFGLSGMSVSAAKALACRRNLIIRLATFFVRPVSSLVFLAHLYRQHRYFSFWRPKLRHRPRCLMTALSWDDETEQRLVATVQGRLGREFKYFRTPIWWLTPRSEQILAHGSFGSDQFKRYATASDFVAERKILVNRLFLQDVLKNVFICLGLIKA
ncbi:MAG: hypothetical protein NTV81_02800 [Candidatus Komeilibacteria bacterium]|nr:hypothetical protein [Candidatus Komeilibacteria bacterium]